MSLTTLVVLVLALFVVQLFLQETSLYHFNLWQIMGNRDVRPKESLVAARLNRAKNNMLESLPLFLGLAMLNFFKASPGGLAELGALIFLLARLVYVPVYAAGIPILRSLIWLIAMSGLLIMTLPLL